MAKVKLGALAQDVRGSIAGQTFSRNKGGSYVRQKVSPTQPQTARQMAQRAILAQVANAWGLLPAADRSEWYTYAENHPVLDVFGDSVRLNGAAMFQQLNARLVTCGSSIEPEVPTVPPATPVTVASVAVNNTTQMVTVTMSDSPPTTQRLMFFGWVSSGNQTATPKSKLRLAFTVEWEGNSNNTSSNLATLNPLLSIAQDERLHWRALVIDERGRVLAVTTGSTIAATP